jgi:hypothetical protein
MTNVDGGAKPNLALMRREIRVALAEARDLRGIKEVRDKVHALSTYARDAQDKEALRELSEIHYLAALRAGELLRDMPKQNGARGIGKSGVVIDDSTLTLSRLGMSKDQSSRWQKLAAMDAGARDAGVESLRSRERLITVEAVLKYDTTPKVKNKKTAAAADSLLCRAVKAVGSVTAKRGQRKDLGSASGLVFMSDVAEKEDIPETELQKAASLAKIASAALMDRVNDNTITSPRAAYKIARLPPAEQPAAVDAYVAELQRRARQKVAATMPTGSHAPAVRFRAAMKDIEFTLDAALGVADWLSGEPERDELIEMVVESVQKKTTKLLASLRKGRNSAPAVPVALTLSQ